MARSESKKTTRAAGCVVYRQKADDPDRIEVLLAHRPKYDDWDFPKGHVEDGETELEAAIRETEEEVCARGTLGPELPTVFYKVKGRDKSIRWWLLRYDDGTFVANKEVDAVAWVEIDRLADELTYDNARTLVPYIRTALGLGLEPTG